MGTFVASKTIKLMLQKGVHIKGANILILGFTFKENCPDIRNTSVINIYRELLEYDTKPVVCDPWIDILQVEQLYNIRIIDIDCLIEKKFDAIILAVAHDLFFNINLNA